jgi:hypothetical protein
MIGEKRFLPQELQAYFGSSSMSKHVFMGVIASAALAFGSGASAQTAVSQATNNGNTVTNSGTITIQSGGISGVGGSAAVSATGAVSATSVAGINAALPGPDDGFSAVTQSATNSGVVNNLNPAANDIDGGGGTLALGASASITATGALSSFSFSGIGASAWITPGVSGPVSQSSTNNAAVTNSGTPMIGNFAGLLGDGSSASIGATGAAASAGFSFIGDGDVTAGTVGNITQSANNQAAGTTTNTGGSIPLSGPIDGAGASASISATGAIASVSLSHIANTTAEGQFDLAAISQGSTNAANITNSGNIATTSGGLSGVGSSAVISATGAAASVSSSSIAATVAPGTSAIDSMGQSVSNSGAVSNTGTISLASGISGAGAAASVSAVGAGAYASFSAVK